MAFGFLGELFDKGASIFDKGGSQATQPQTQPQPQVQPTTPPVHDATGGIGQIVDDLGRGVGSGGLGALLDPVGTVDRQRAQRELQGKFDIVAPDFAGQRMPNQITQEEFEKVSKNYSDIRLGRTDIKLDATGAKDQDKFKEDMMGEFGTMMQTKAGRDTIAKLSDNRKPGMFGFDTHKTTTFKPRIVNGVPDNANAAESADSSPGAGMPFADGTPGKGSDATIAFNPGMNVSTGRATYRSDVALYHEMVHALHDTAGTTAVGNVQAGDGVPHDENFRGPNGQRVPRYEHQAVGLGVHAGDTQTENAYRRERNQVAQSGVGLVPGDATMPQRDVYAGYKSNWTPT